MIVSSEFLMEFQEFSHPLHLKRKEIWIQEGQIAPYLGIVKSGTLFSYLENSDKERQINNLYGPLSVVSSYRSFLTQTPSVGIIQAYTDCEIEVVDFQTYQDLMENSDWLKKLKWLGDEMYIEKCRKQTSLTTLNSKERYYQLLDEFPRVEQLFPQHMIASYLNIRPETLSRLKSHDLGQEKI